MSAPSDDDWPEGWAEAGDKCLLKDKLLVPKDLLKELIYHSPNDQLMQLGRDKLQKNLELRFLFTPGDCAVMNRYRKACAVCRVT